MLFKKIKDYKLRQLYKYTEYQIKLLKLLRFQLLAWLKNKIYSKFLHFKLLKKLKHRGQMRMKNRCILTNRNKGNIAFFNISRIQFRNLAQLGLLPGYRKAVW